MAYIKLENVYLEYPISYSEKSIRVELIEKLTNKNKNFSFHSALKNINLEINDGERVGIIGLNGSGKSTLLRIISGIYKPTKGAVITEGKKLTMLDLNSGIQMESTGLDNIYLISYLRGYKTHEIKKIVDKIIEFSGLGEAIFKPVRTYSSGMIARLSASMVLNFSSNILILDEFISVGDQDFHEKFEIFMLEKIKKSQIMIIASHDHELIDEICTKKIIMQEGKIQNIVTLKN